MEDGQVVYQNVSENTITIKLSRKTQFSFGLLTTIINFLGVQACSYPGTAISGRMSAVKFYYSIGESITFTCDAGLELRGARMLKCLKNGKWSSAIPTCLGTEPPNV